MKQHVVVAGGGLIGLCTAYWLLRDGHRVTIIDRTRLGAGAGAVHTASARIPRRDGR